MEERNILIRCSNISQIVKLIDAFIENDRSYMIIEYPSGETLKKTVLKLGSNFLKETEVKKCVLQVLKILKDLNRLRVKHGNITLDSVIARKRSKGLELKLGSFEKAV